MLEWHATPAALGPPVAGPFRFSKQGSARRREARAVFLLAELIACAVFVLAGWAAGGAPGAVVGVAAAVATAAAGWRLEVSYFARVVPAVEVHEKGLCFCDAARPVLFEEVQGLLVGPSALLLAFKKGLDAAAAPGGAKRPWWERALRKRAYWEIPLDGFADPKALVEAVKAASKLPVAEPSEEVLDAIRSRAAQAIARVPASPVEFRF